MIVWWLLLLGIFVYFVVQRSVASITRTPVWALWLVMMMPALVLTGWVLIYGDEEPVPLVLLLGLFVLCPIAYWVLIQWGRVSNAELQEVRERQRKEILEKLEGKRPTVRPINKEEEASLRHCFPWSIFYLQNLEYRPQAVICRGQLRSNPEVAYQTIRDNVESRFGDRFLVIFQEGMNRKPFFALVPNPQAQSAKKSTKLTRPFLALGLLLATLLTTTLMGIVIAGISETDLQNDPALLAAGLPYAIALIVILGTHELGHYLAARFYKIKATLPYFIPVPFFLGTFGAFIQLRSPVPNRKALFDVGIAGPLSGFVVTLPLLIWGLAQSQIVPLPEEPSLLNFEAFTPSTSLLIALLSKLALGNQLSMTDALSLHPVAIAGCIGLVVTALNLMPVGQLDGGHIVHAMLGQRAGAIIGQVARFLVLGLALIQRELLLWAILLFFIPAIDEPALNDVSELNNWRDLLGLFALALLVIIVLPVPAVVQSVLF